MYLRKAILWTNFFARLNSKYHRFRPEPSAASTKSQLSAMDASGAITKNDGDPFPSNPHAQNIESGLKLDLSTGELYFKRQSTGKSISRKDLAFIRTKAAEKDVTLPVVS
jgi:hypothetical protein